MINRRKFLSSISCGAPFLAGCIGQSNSSIKISRIAVGNYSPSKKEGVLKIFENDTLKFEKKYSLEGADPDSEVTPSISIEEGLPTSPGDYEVFFSYGDEAKKRYVLKELANSTCVKMLIDITKNENIEAWVSESC